MNKLAIFTVLAVPASAFASSSPISDIEAIPSVEVSVKKQTGFNGMVGLGAINRDVFPGVDDQETNPIPLINVNWNDIVYFEFNKLGGWLYKNEENNFRIGAVVQPRMGCDSDDCNPFFAGDDHEIDSYAVAGIRTKWRSGKFSIDGSLLGSTESDSGSEAVIVGKYTFIMNNNMTLTAQLKIEALSEDAVDYLYYGDTDFGSDLGLNFDSDSAINTSLGLIGTYTINPKWTAIAALTATSLGDAITDAPGVTEDTSTAIVLGAMYRF